MKESSTFTNTERQKTSTRGLVAWNITSSLNRFAPMAWRFIKCRTLEPILAHVHQKGCPDLMCQTVVYPQSSQWTITVLIFIDMLQKSDQ